MDNVSGKVFWVIMCAFSIILAICNGIGIIHTTWLWILAPIWIPLIMTLFCLGLVLILMGIAVIISAIYYTVKDYRSK